MRKKTKEGTRWS